MKGKAASLPHNMVIWDNGFKSNMPDWTTARRCAVVDRLTYLVKEARTVFHQFERGEIDEIRKKVFLESICEAIAWADLGIEPDTNKIRTTPNVVPMPVPTGFPKPPGVK